MFKDRLRLKMKYFAFDNFAVKINHVEGIQVLLYFVFTKSYPVQGVSLTPHWND